MSQTPFTPHQLLDAPLSGPAFLDALQDQRRRRYPDPPPLYRALVAGELSPDGLALWAKDLYAYWDNLYFSTGAIFVKTNDEPTRTHILRKLVDIEGKDIVRDLTGWTTPAYEELWLRFAEGLGVTREEVAGWKVFARTEWALTTLNMYSRWWEWSWLDGVASLYAADLHNHDLLTNAADALRQHYGMSDASLEFFGEFEQDSAVHIEWERRTLAHWACTRERQLTAARAFRERLDIEHQLVLGAWKAASTGNLPVQVP